jgi:hypothetical protein
MKKIGQLGSKLLFLLYKYLGMIITEKWKYWEMINDQKMW